MNSRYRIGLKVQTRTHGIDLDSWYRLHCIVLVLLNQPHTRGRDVILSFPIIVLSIFTMQLTKPSNCSFVMFVVGEVLCSAASSYNYAINCCKVGAPRSHVYTGALAGGVNYNQGGGRVHL